MVYVQKVCALVHHLQRQGLLLNNKYVVGQVCVCVCVCVFWHRSSLRERERERERERARERAPRIVDPFTPHLLAWNPLGVYKGYLG